MMTHQAAVLRRSPSLPTLELHLCMLPIRLSISNFIPPLFISTGEQKHTASICAKTISTGPRALRFRLRTLAIKFVCVLLTFPIDSRSAPLPFSIAEA
jgi:hypothetical protein